MSTLLFLPTPYCCSGLFKSDSWVFRSLCIFCSEFVPTVHAQLFLVPYGFFVFCSLRRGVSRCRLCSTGFQAPGHPPVRWEALDPWMPLECGLLNWPLVSPVILSCHRHKPPECDERVTPNTKKAYLFVGSEHCLPLWCGNFPASFQGTRKTYSQFI